MNSNSRVLFALPTALLFFSLICVLSCHVPFFWDVAYFSEQAGFFFRHGFSSLLPPADLDNSGFPLYGILLALVWKTAGRTLLVSHLAILALVFGITGSYYHLLRKFLRPAMIPYALLLFCLEPCFLTQSILMAPDLLLLFFFLSAVNALLEKKLVLFALFLLFLGACSVRGLITAGAIALLPLLFGSDSVKNRLRYLWCYLPILIFILGWAIYHHRQSGWYFLSPLRAGTDEHLIPTSLLFKQLLLLCWKMADSGRLILWLIFTAGIWIKKESFRADLLFRRLVFLLVILLITDGLLMIPLSNPGSARYFLPVFSLLMVGVCYLLQDLSAGKKQIWFAFISLVLISGNFWIYPERLSNGWDTSLKVIPYFGLRNEMTVLIRDHDIQPEEIATQFPLIGDRSDTYLEPFHDQFINALDGPVSKFHYYLHSNVCNTDLLPQIEEIKLRWKTVCTLKKGQVYLNLYENPDWK
jgi:hypothetical protein